GPVVWEWQNTNRRWTSFRPAAVGELEAAKENGESRVTLALNGTQAQVDLDTEQIAFGDGDIKADVRRSVSRAEPADRHKPLPSEKRRAAMTRVASNSADAAKPKRNVEDAEVIAKKSRLEKAFNEEADCEAFAEVDPECAQKVGVARVYCEKGDFYDAMLNQANIRTFQPQFTPPDISTNIAQNNNKYYLMQVLEDNTGGNYSVWFRWGRVGYSGQKKLTEFGNDLDGAKKMFTQKFYDKTLNNFEDRKSFEKVHGKYDLVQIDRSKKKVAKKEPKSGEEKENEVESKLDERLQHLMQLITDMGAMEKALRKLDYDTQRAPL
ncbi:WGR domain containing protein, partial [Aphelenchoides avenae]